MDSTHVKYKCVFGTTKAKDALETLLILVHYVCEDRGMGAWACILSSLTRKIFHIILLYS